MEWLKITGSAGLAFIGVATLIAQSHSGPTNAVNTPVAKPDTLIPVWQRKPAPDFTLMASNGEPLKLSAYKGKVVLLDFWATWCGGCKLELPWYIDFDGRYRNRGLAVVGVSMDDGGMAIVKPFLSQKHILYPVVMGSEELGKQYNLTLMPMTLLIDRQGRIALTHAGVVNRTDFERHIQELLRTAAAR